MTWKDKYPDLDLNFITDYIPEMEKFTKGWDKIKTQTLKQAIFFLEDHER